MLLFLFIFENKRKKRKMWNDFGQFGNSITIILFYDLRYQNDQLWNDITNNTNKNEKEQNKKKDQECTIVIPLLLRISLQLNNNNNKIQLNSRNVNKSNSNFFPKIFSGLSVFLVGILFIHLKRTQFIIWFSVLSDFDIWRRKKNGIFFLSC